MRGFRGMILIGAGVLSACGGGGGQMSGPPPPPSDPMLALFAGAPNGPGSADGTGAAASFYRPRGVATDAAGNVYIADSYNNVIRKITPAGVVTTFAGTAGVTGNADGQGAAASFSFPVAVATDGAGNIYVADGLNDVIRKITPAAVVTTFAATPFPNGVTVDSTGNLYVAGDEVILKVTPAGVVTTFAGLSGFAGSADGTGANARFNAPEGLATDSAGNLYVADSGNYTIRKITPAAVVTTFAGTAGVGGSTDGTGPGARFLLPRGVALDGAGNLYVADLNAIREITPAAVVTTTLAGNDSVAGSADGTGADARFSGPEGLATDSAGNLYVADTFNDIVRKVTGTGVVTTLAGFVGAWGSADGTVADARFNGPYGIAADSAGDVYVADALNSTIRRITPEGVVTTVAGMAGVRGSADGNGAAARFAGPEGVAPDGAGNVYVSDVGNCTIRKITPEGVVTTLAGTAGTCGSNDGTGATASFSSPKGVAVDSTGDVFVADEETIRKITPVGVVTTFAGTAGKLGTNDGTGAAASFVGPTGVAVDAAGNVYVTDNGFTGENGLPVHLIRVITPAAVVSTLNTATGPVVDLRGLAVNAAGNVYVADAGSDVILKLTPAGALTTIVGRSGQYGFMPGPLPGLLSGPTSVTLFGGTLFTTTNNAIVQVTNVL